MSTDKPHIFDALRQIVDDLPQYSVLRWRRDGEVSQFCIGGHQHQSDLWIESSQAAQEEHWSWNDLSYDQTKAYLDSLDTRNGLVHSIKGNFLGLLYQDKEDLASFELECDYQSEVPLSVSSLVLSERSGAFHPFSSAHEALEGKDGALREELSEIKMPDAPLYYVTGRNDTTFLFHQVKGSWKMLVRGLKAPP